MNLCNYCGEPLLNKRSKYCSKACTGKAKVKSKVSKKCLTCENEFVCGKDKRKKFCNRSCSAKFNNLGNTRHGIPSVGCNGCDGLASGRNKTGYCSTKCRQDHEVQRYLNGELSGSAKYTLATYAKRYVRERAGNKCEHCGYDTTRKDGSSILQIDHIDGNWENNRPDNLRLLCPNCHCLTPNWGAANMGRGRSWKGKYDQFGRPLSPEKERNIT